MMNISLFVKPQQIMLDLNSAYKDLSIEVERYKQSNRPIVEDMVHIPLKSGKYIPVVRYEGLYYSGRETTKVQYLGKFYFYEPESTFGINLGNYLVAANKYQAIRFFEEKMLGNFDEIGLLRLGVIPNILSLYYLLLVTDIKYNNISFICTPNNEVTVEELSLEQSYTKFADYVRDIFSNRSVPWISTFLDALIETKIELTTIMKTEEDIANYKIKIISNIEYDILGNPQIKPNGFIENYNGNLYSLADYLDQPLVVLARKFGYDTIILQREVGEYNIITEVVDCREDNNNISKIEVISTLPIISRYPLIWTNTKGLMSF